MLSSLARLPTKEIITFSEDDYFLATEERSCKEECEEKDSFCALGQVLLMSVCTKVDNNIDLLSS